MSAWPTIDLASMVILNIGLDLVIVLMGFSTTFETLSLLHRALFLLGNNDLVRNMESLLYQEFVILSLFIIAR